MNITAAEMACLWHQAKVSFHRREFASNVKAERKSLGKSRRGEESRKEKANRKHTGKQNKREGIEKGKSKKRSRTNKIKRERERETTQTMLSFSSPSYTCRRLIKSPLDLPLDLRPRDFKVSLRSGVVAS